MFWHEGDPQDFGPAAPADLGEGQQGISQDMRKRRQGTNYMKTPSQGDAILLYDQTTGNGSQRKPKLLDLFCCAGGAGVGYSRAGFEVIGVDITPQPRYPLPFIQTDALKLDPKFIALFDAIHASPPCQSYSDLAKRNGNADEWPRLIEPVREMIIRSGLPYVMENVDGAPLRDPMILCGTMFKGMRVLRHRLFKTNFPLLVPPHPKFHILDNYSNAG